MLTIPTTHVRFIVCLSLILCFLSIFNKWLHKLIQVFELSRLQAEWHSIKNKPDVIFSFMMRWNWISKDNYSSLSGVEGRTHRCRDEERCLFVCFNFKISFSASTNIWEPKCCSLTCMMQNFKTHNIFLQHHRSRDFSWVNLIVTLLIHVVFDLALSFSQSLNVS